ncbi:unnamed protein product [Calicophoron daubneyi]|uniref:Cation efflux protein transmembrane domain-containing protein n=1 Tax=Calicophoron daubneyi TaxID=300641 RepID=A0AAV2TC98_CALDB
MNLPVRLLCTLKNELDDARSFLSKITSETRHLVAVENRAGRLLVAAIVVSLCLFYMMITCNVSNSLALTAFTHLLIFDLLSLVVSLISLWSKRKSATLSSYTLGYERFEVVAVFAATILAVLSSVFELKEAAERIFEPVEVYPQALIIACPVALFVHLLTVYGIENPAFSHVVLASGSSWLQEHTTDISRTICHAVPGLARILLPRINPFSLVGIGTSSVVAGVYWMMVNTVEENTPHPNLPDPLPDTLGSVIISLMLFGTMLPMMLYSGRILLQTIPSHLVGPLDKAFREASTIDGVLELRNEHVWSIGFDSLAGSLYVRVRRDANEQFVLAHVANRLNNLVKYLTVQVYKDDWTRTSTTPNWPPIQSTHIHSEALLTPEPVMRYGLDPLSANSTHGIGVNNQTNPYNQRLPDLLNVPISLMTPQINKTGTAKLL